MQADVAREQLRARILDGVYAPGQRLTEIETAGALAMSRTPVREAFRALAADGLVTPAGRGVQVTTLGPAELRDAYQVRAALEALTAELAAARQAAGEIAPAALAALVRDAELAEQATEAGELWQAALRNRAFHRRIAGLAANPAALAILDRLWDQILVSTRQSLTTPGRGAAAGAEHRDLLDAIRAGQPEAAARAARDHVLAHPGLGG
ncbi:GntR family transcriptional regulator [Longispora albida]|uniref:GntR family transcriptional regulator n=1 Tax=Longispora albida TaxID=203523 RepID=UPI000374ED9C|nr:GntR family transcriptional regulator [Longispora albida]